MNDQFGPLSVNVHVRPLVQLPDVLHENPLVHRILSSRGITDANELDLALGGLPRPDQLPNIALAVSRLMLARERGEKVLIVGDYDCDGATSTSVAMLGFEMLGFNNVDYLIPNRFEHGYGLSPAIVDQAQQLHQPGLIVTVDNGVASVEGVDHAASLGIDVVVTDHHLPPEILPRAIAIVNPNLSDSNFPSLNLAGVGVIFYTLIALRAAFAKQADSVASAPIADLLDLVAIGTVADVVPLDATNRILVEQGLRRIRRGKTRFGVSSLLSAAGCKSEVMSTQDIGFGIGPRLNAAGRIDDMRLGVECLLSRSKADADSLSQKLNSFNEQRRAIERDMRSTAEEQLASLSLEDLNEADTFSVCLHDDEWHQGVIGILAGRIKESLHRPVVVFTSDNDEEIKGSARSIPGVHIRDVLQSIATQHVGMIEKFGGHAMAAGLTLKRQYLDEFREAFESTVREALNNELRVREFHTDGSLPAAQRTLNNAAILATIMPWGQGFEAPMFSDYFAVATHRVVGTGHLKLTLNAWGDSDLRPVDAIAFNCDVVPIVDQPVFAIYSLDVNTWRDRQSLQLRVHHLEQAALR
jgi:single-stranded-DNA-specific exonuclease